MGKDRRVHDINVIRFSQGERDDDELGANTDANHTCTIFSLTNYNRGRQPLCFCQAQQYIVPLNKMT